MEQNNVPQQSQQFLNICAQLKKELQDLKQEIKLYHIEVSKAIDEKRMARVMQVINNSDF